MHVKSQRLLVHAGMALAMPPQLAHDGPHEVMLLSASQLSPHAWYPVTQLQRWVS